jgi:hypothetical protein
MYSIHPQSLVLLFIFCHLLSISLNCDVNINYFCVYPFIFHHILLHSIALASIPFALLVAPYRLLVGPSERLLAYFHSLHYFILLGFG